MLVLASWTQLDAFPSKILRGLVRENNAAFTISNEFPHGAMRADPQLVNAFHEGLDILVRTNTGGMASCAPTDHVNADAFADKKQITLNLIVELDRYFHTSHVVWAWIGPFAIHLAGLINVRDELQDSLCNSDSAKESLHDMFRGT